MKKKSSICCNVTVKLMSIPSFNLIQQLLQRFCLDDGKKKDLLLRFIDMSTWQISQNIGRNNFLFRLDIFCQFSEF